MMSGCFSPPGGGDPWAHDYEDDRLYRMSARKFNKHMAEKRRRYRINTALERLKYIILHVMRRNPEHFDKMEKADILDLTVKFLKAVERHEGLPGARPPPAHSHHRTSGSGTGSTSAGPNLPTTPRLSAQPNIRVYQDSPQMPLPSPASPGSSHPRHQGVSKGRTAFPGLKTRSGNIPSAVVRATQQDCDVTSGFASMKPRTSGSTTTLSCSPLKRLATASEGLPSTKKLRVSSASSAPSSAGSARDLGCEESLQPFGRNLEYRVHSAFHFQGYRDSDHIPPPPLFHPIPKHFMHGQASSTSTRPSSSVSSFPTSTSTSTSEQIAGPSLSMEDPSAKATNTFAVKPLSSKLPGIASTSSKTSELTIEIPEVDIRMAVPPLQPLPRVLQVSPPDLLPMPLPLPVPQSGGMWRPW